MKFDASKLNSIVTKKCEAKAKQVIDTVLIQVAEDINYHSPVGQPQEWASKAPADYKAGQYKANWNHSVDIPNTEYVEVFDDTIMQTESETSEKMIATIKQNKKLNAKHYFRNNSPYAMEMEYGLAIHNPQAQTQPLAVAGLALQNIPKFVSNAKKLLRGVK